MIKNEKIKTHDPVTKLKLDVHNADQTHAGEESNCTPVVADP